MKGVVAFLLAAGSAAGLVGMANAQPVGGAAHAILFDQPNFQGHSITIVDGAPDLARWGFAGRAMSARLEGVWTLCDEPDLDGHCATVRGDIVDMSQTGLRGVFSLGENDPDDGQAADANARAADQPALGDKGKAVDASGRESDQPAQGGRWSGSSDDRAPASPSETQAAAAPQATPASPAPTVQGEAGRSAVFFAKPVLGSDEVAIDVQGPANQFCHDQGLGPAVYFDTDGRVLRNVLCRRS